MYSKAFTYGIRTVLYIVTQSLDDKQVKIPDVTNSFGSLEAFTAKVLGKLNNVEVINSYKRPNGGLKIKLPKIKTTKLEEIAYAIASDSLHNVCALGLSECDVTDPCPIHKRFFEIREELKNMLGATVVYEFAFGLKSKNQHYCDEKNF